MQAEGGWQRLVSRGEPREGTTTYATTNRGNRVLLVRSQGKVYATQPNCGHMRYPLVDGKVDGSVLTCPLHKVRWELGSGRPLSAPKIPWPLSSMKVGRGMRSVSCEPLRVYEVEERSDGVYVRLNAPGD